MAVPPRLLAASFSAESQGARSSGRDETESVRAAISVCDPDGGDEGSSADSGTAEQRLLASLTPLAGWGIDETVDTDEDMAYSRAAMLLRTAFANDLESDALIVAIRAKRTRAYRLYRITRPLRRVLSWGFGVLLGAAEVPAWRAKPGASTAKFMDTMRTLELVLLACLWLDCAAQLYILKSKRVHLRKPSLAVQLALLALLSVLALTCGGGQGALANCVCASTADKCALARWQATALLRAAFLLAYSQSLRRQSVLLATALLDASVPLLLLFLLVVVAAWVGLLIFGYRHHDDSNAEALHPPLLLWTRSGHSINDNDDTIFPHLGGAMLNLFVLATAASNPDAWLMYARETKSAALFFVPYVTCADLLATAFVLAKVYASYSKATRRTVERAAQARRHAFDTAFAILDESNHTGSGPGSGWIGPRTISALLGHLNKYRGEQAFSFEQLQYFFLQLHSRRRSSLRTVDLDCVGSDATTTALHCRIDDFRLLASVMRLRFRREASPSAPGPLEHAVRMVKCQPSCGTAPEAYTSLKRDLAKGSKLDAMLSAVLLAAALIAGSIVVSVDRVTDHHPITSDVARACGLFAVIFHVMRFLMLGRRTHLRGIARYDTLCACAFSLPLVYSVMIPDARGKHRARDVACYVVGLWSLRALGLIRPLTRHFRGILLALVAAAPALLSIVALGCAIVVIFAHVGVSLFAGQLHASNPALANTAYLKAGWAGVFTFDDPIAAAVSLFNIAVVNQWMVVLYALQAVAPGKGEAFVLVYFVTSVYGVVNLLRSVMINAMLAGFGEKVRSSGGNDSNRSDEQSIERMSSNVRLLRQRTHGSVSHGRWSTGEGSGGASRASFAGAGDGGDAAASPLKKNLTLDTIKVGPGIPTTEWASFAGLVLDSP